MSDQSNSDKEDEGITFKSLGLVPQICEACASVNWPSPTPIQKETIPSAINGRDIIGLAETGSGKTGAFALPILQSLLDKPQKNAALILTPTRELAFQISEHFQALGTSFGVKCAVIVGGVDRLTQALTLAKGAHVIIATPGRLVDHLENTKGFNLNNLRFLVMDEADRILNMDFEAEVEKILKVIPKKRNTYLFSATMTTKVQKLQRASMKNPLRVEVGTKYQTVDKLQQSYLFIPAKYKETYLVYLLTQMGSSQSTMVFTATCNSTQKINYLLQHLGIKAVALHGQLNQSKRLAALSKFKSKSRNVLIATDVASRGLDIPHVDCVINYDVPANSKDYIHRVGRTARAGRAGKAVTIITQYDVELYQRIESMLGQKLPLYPDCDESAAMVMLDRVNTALQLATADMRNVLDRKRGRHADENDTEEAAYTGVIRKNLKFGFKKKKYKRK